MKGPVRHHIRTLVVMAKDGAEVRTSLSQTMGTPLAHTNSMAIALAADQQLQSTRGWPELRSSSQRGRRCHQRGGELLDP